MFLAFGVFIFSCGCTHLLEVWTLWHPTYWLSGTVKAITAVASMATAIGIAPLVPRVFRFIEAAKTSEQHRQALEKAHHEMAAMNQRLRELDELRTRFFANVSHELRTPLTLILGNTDRLREGHNLNAEQWQSLSVIERNGLVLHQHVNNLLDAAKLESGQMQLHYAETDVASLVRVVCSNFDSLSRDRAIAFSIEAPATLPAQVDPQKVEEVLVNLLSNAFKFTPRVGRVRCTLSQENGDVLLEVADSGPGVPLEARQRIFERFRQLDTGDDRRFGGTGLGLCIAKDFVELHRGSITVGQSREGGASFTVRLPRTAPAGEKVQAESPPAASPAVSPARKAVAELAAPAALPSVELSTHRSMDPLVLVVEDNAEMAQLMHDTLSPAYRTVAATNGVEALEKARALNPDLILTDLMMPYMSGEQLLHKLRAEPAFDPVPVVVVTARADDRVRVQLLREGAQDYLLKPFTREELHARVSNLVSARRARLEIERVNKELEAFSYSLAHDMRAQLRSIRSFAQLLQEDYPPASDSEASLFLRNINNSAGRLDQLVTNVLTYSRLGGGTLQLHAVDLENLLESLVQESQHLQPPQAKVVLRKPLHRVMGDEGALTQVAANLLGNAVKFVAPGVAPQVEVSTELSDGLVRVWFKDNGIGIEAKDQERVFGLFQRLHSEAQYSGTGLGLAIVRKAVERMGGTIGLKSAPGQGSSFWIELQAPD